MSINDAKWTVAPDVLASSITSFLLLTFVKFHAEIFSNCSHSLSTAAFAAGIFMAWSIGKICVTNCNVAVNCPLSLQDGPHDNSVEILPYAFLWIHWLPRYTQIYTWSHSSCCGSLQACFSCKSCKASLDHWCFQFSSCILNDFLDLHGLKVNEIDLSKSSCIIELWFFNCPFILLPQHGVLWNSSPEFWP